MEDKSIIKNTDTVDVNATYINDCIKEVCLKGDSLTKYKRMIEKQYGAEFYQKCGNFVKEVKHSVNRKKFTQTSIANLNHLANEINVTSATIETLIDYYTKKFADDEKIVRKTKQKHDKNKEKLEKKSDEDFDKELNQIGLDLDQLEKELDELHDDLKHSKEELDQIIEDDDDEFLYEEDTFDKEDTFTRKYFLYAIPVCCTLVGYLWGTSIIPESWGVQPPVGTTFVGLIAGMILKAVVEGIIEGIEEK